jgi:hypothetical protein
VISFVTFRWRAPPGYRKSFPAETVNIHRRMIARHYPHPHRYVHVTDDPTGITEPDIEVFELWRDLAHVPNPFHGGPSCYRRLKLFAGNAGGWLGQRICMMDLDCVIVRDLTPLLHVPDDFKIWQNPLSGHVAPRRRTISKRGPVTHCYNGGFWLLTAGARRELWDDFDPVRSPIETKQAGFFGSDQAWIAYRLGGGESVWTPTDGVYSWKFHVKQKFGGRLPDNARVVFFHGKPGPVVARMSSHPVDCRGLAIAA